MKHPSEIWARRIVRSKKSQGKWVRLACQRHLDDLKNGHERGLYFDEDAANHVVEFFGKYLRHSKGVWSGRKFELSDWQVFIISNLFGWKREGGLRRFRTAYLEVPRKNGKALALDTLVPTSTGWTTMKNIRLGDRLFDERGWVCRVIYVSEIMHDHSCYEITFSDGTKIVADAEHQWWTNPRSRTGRKSGKRRPKKMIFTTEQILRTLHSGNRGNPGFREHNHSVPVAAAIQLIAKPYILEPYLLGCWLGDGHTSSARITTTDIEILNAFRNAGFEIKNVGKEKITYAIDGLSCLLHELGIINDKHIPEGYFRGSPEQRLALLQGLMDTDGYCDKRGNCEFTTINKQLAEDTYDLIITLGIKAVTREKEATIYGKKCGPKYRIQFCAYNDIPVFRLKRKYERQSPRPDRIARSQTRQIIDVKPIKSVPVRCIQVDSPSNLFLVSKSMIPTHNTTFGAGVGLYLMAADDEPGSEVYSAATQRAMAKLSHEEAKRMVWKSPQLKKHLKVFRDNIHWEKTFSKFEPLGRDADATEGLNVHGAIVDELHAHRTRDMWDVLETATGSRSQSLIFAITTAGTDQAGICYEQHTYVKKILEGIIDDDSYFGMIYTIDEDDDWTSSKVWAKANPNFGISIYPDDLKRLAQKATEIPSAQSAFLRKRLNVWVGAASPWMDMLSWQACSVDGLSIEQFKDKECWIALDLASKIDIAAMAILFRNGDEYALFGKFYLPEDAVRSSNNAQYEGWARAGYLTVTPGNATDFGYIKDDLRKLKDNGYDIREIPYDSYQAHQFSGEMFAEGFPMVEVGATVKNFSEPMKELEALVLGKRIKHDGCPVMGWMVSNVVCHVDRKDNVFPRKERDANKIDGVVAAIMAMNRALVNKPKELSVYETRGPLSFGVSE